MATSTRPDPIPPSGPGSRAMRLYHRPLIRKLWKYSMTSVVGVIVGQSLIFLFASVLEWSWAWANLWAVAISTVPTYYLSRTWVWQKRGKSSLYAEIVPFWVMALLGLTLSTIFVVLLERRYPDSPILANVGNWMGFGCLWLIKFVMLDKVLFKVTHEEPEGPYPFL